MRTGLDDTGRASARVSAHLFGRFQHLLALVGNLNRGCERLYCDFQIRNDALEMGQARLRRFLFQLETRVLFFEYVYLASELVNMMFDAVQLGLHVLQAKGGEKPGSQYCNKGEYCPYDRIGTDE